MDGDSSDGGASSCGPSRRTRGVATLVRPNCWRRELGFGAHDDGCRKVTYFEGFL